MIRISLISQMHVYRAGNGASHKEQCVIADLEIITNITSLSHNTSSNEEVTYILLVSR